MGFDIHRKIGILEVSAGRGFGCRGAITKGLMKSIEVESSGEGP
jgi:hypothetical protein